MRKRVFITVKTYPNPSRNYQETVCTAGLDEDKNWIRIYPVNFRAKPTDQQYKKFQWIELDLLKTTGRDFRPESYHLVDLDVDIQTLDFINSWDVRNEYMLHRVYDSLKKLLSDSLEPKNTSLATYKPFQITRAHYEEDRTGWDKEQADYFTQMSIFDSGHKPLRKLPYKFKYEFVDGQGSRHDMQVLDWEIGALYWNCIRSSASELLACRKVIDKLNEIASKKDLYFILGTTLDHHQRRLSNPFTIVGLYYPPRNEQTSIF
jgi:hypothetical protein